MTTYFTVREINALAHMGATLEELAAWFRVSTDEISAVLAREPFKTAYRAGVETNVEALRRAQEMIDRGPPPT